MALGVNFPENEDVVAFGRKNEMLVLLVSILGMYKKMGNYAEKSELKGFTIDRHVDFKKFSNTCDAHFLLYGTKTNGIFDKGMT